MDLITTNIGSNVPVYPIYTRVHGGMKRKGLSELVIESFGYPDEDAVFAFPETATGLQRLLYWSERKRKFFYIETEADRSPPPPRRPRLLIGQPILWSRFRRRLLN